MSHKNILTEESPIKQFLFKLNFFLYLPSSKAENIIQEAGYHKSHLKKKQVYGHQLFTTMLSTGAKVLPYSVERYRKGEKSKIQMLCEIISELPLPQGKAYGLCDSWFTNKEVINAHFKI